jgi:hypothetical protein
VEEEDSNDKVDCNEGLGTDSDESHLHLQTPLLNWYQIQSVSESVSEKLGVSHFLFYIDLCAAVRDK